VGPRAAAVSARAARRAASIAGRAARGGVGEVSGARSRERVRDRTREAFAFVVLSEFGPLSLETHARARR
jgi:hypothetical protein